MRSSMQRDTRAHLPCLRARATNLLPSCHLPLLASNCAAAAGLPLTA